MGDGGNGRTGGIVQGDIERYAEDQPVLVFVLGFRREEAGLAADVLTLHGRAKEAIPPIQVSKPALVNWGLSDESSDPIKVLLRRV